ncbi:hypothetical protein ACFZCU_39130 [Streptomyces canus]|uniref:ATP dependent DNA ligase n=1 Tax=Streptomyces canus TaxID=58343 RepID=UPI0036E17DBE
MKSLPQEGRHDELKRPPRECLLSCGSILRAHCRATGPICNPIDGRPPSLRPQRCFAATPASGSRTRSEETGIARPQILRLHQQAHETTEAIVGAVTGPLTAPRGLLLGRYDDGRLQYTGRATTLTRTASATVAGQLASAQHGHPWTGWSFSAGWGSRETLNATLMEPELVVEVGVDVARDAAGRWRHPARLHRARPDLSPADVPRWTSAPH